jgi:DNA invertase Pin-like site-specific DNA recombinase
MKNRIYAYIRVSTEKQSLQNQKGVILEYAQQNKMIVDDFIEVEISSMKSQRERKIEELLSRLDSGDILIVTELSRLGRKMIEVLSLIERLNEKGVQLVFVTQPELSTNQNSALSSLLLAIYGYFAQTEREILSERTRNGMRASSNKAGRPKGTTGKSKLDDRLDEVKQCLELGLNMTSIAKLLQCDRSTVKNFITTRGLSND